jgi:hypothetical protein
VNQNGLERSAFASVRRILFVVNEPGEFIELQRVGILAKHSGFAVDFLFAQPGYINLGRDRAACRYHRFGEYFPGKPLRLRRRTIRNLERAEKLQGGYLPFSLSTASKPRRSRVVRFLTLAFLPLFALRYRIAKLRRRFTMIGPEIVLGVGGVTPFRYALAILRQLNPDLVVFGQEFPGSVNSVLTKQCKRKNIATLIVPFALGTTKEIVESLVDKPEFEVDYSIANQVAAQIYPHWVNYYQGKEMIRLPGHQVLILEAMDLAPEHPWLPNSSWVDAIAVESAQMARYYRSMSFPESQLRVTGSPLDDTLSSTLRRRAELKSRISRLLRLDPDKKLLVCAWPTDQFGSRFIPLEFKNYTALCHAWASVLARVASLTDFTVVIRPHPVTDVDALAEMLKPYRLQRRITSIDTATLIGIGDLFVACVSSTLRWAIACGVPAINYDCYDYGYNDFDTAGGLKTVRRFSDFDATMESITEDAEVYAEARMKQEAVAPEWGMLDGKSSARVLQLIDSLTARG